MMNMLMRNTFIPALILAATGLVSSFVIFTQSPAIADASIPIPGVCDGMLSSRFEVHIVNDEVAPIHSYATYCDTLVITNDDARERLVAFGQHHEHISYNGVSEKVLQPGDRIEVLLTQIGDFQFHDHYMDETQGSFSVLDR